MGPIAKSAQRGTGVTSIGAQQHLPVSTTSDIHNGRNFGVACAGANTGGLTLVLYYTSGMRKGSRKKADHSDLLSMALVGYESAKDAIDQKILEIKRMIGGGGRAISAAVETYTTVTPKKRRTLSAKAKKAIGDAARKRWAERRKALKAATKTVKKVKTKVRKAVKAAKAKAADAVPF